MKIINYCIIYVLLITFYKVLCWEQPVWSDVQFGWVLPDPSFIVILIHSNVILSKSRSWTLRKRVQVKYHVIQYSTPLYGIIAPAYV